MRTEYLVAKQEAINEWDMAQKLSYLSMKMGTRKAWDFIENHYLSKSFTPEQFPKEQKIEKAFEYFLETREPVE